MNLINATTGQHGPDQAVRGPWRAVLRALPTGPCAGPNILARIPERLAEDLDYEVAVLRGSDDAIGTAGLYDPDVLYVRSDACGDFVDGADLVDQWTRAQTAAAALNAYLPQLAAGTLPTGQPEPVIAGRLRPGMVVCFLEDWVRIVAVDDCDPENQADGECPVTASRCVIVECESIPPVAHLTPARLIPMHLATADEVLVAPQPADPGMWAEPIQQPAWTVQVGCQVQAPTGTWLTATKVDVDGGSTTIHSPNGDIGHADSDQLLAVRYPIVVDQDRLSRLTGDLAQAYEEIGRRDQQIAELRRELADRSARLDAYLTNGVVSPPKAAFDDQPESDPIHVVDGAGEGR